MDQKSSTLLQNIATRATILKVQPNRQGIQEQILKMKTSDTAYYFVIGPAETISLALDVVSWKLFCSKKVLCIVKDRI